MEIIGVALSLAIVVLLCAAAWRFVSFRNRGSHGLLRLLPASGVHGWRHGVFRYNGECLKFYKLRSLAFRSDIRLDRRGTEVDRIRELTEAEKDIMPEIDRILVLRSRNGAYEFASDRRARMALVSWLESAPNERQIPREVKIHAQRAAGGRTNWT